VLYTIGLLAAADLGWTAQHVLFHRIPSLWELHKVHHAAPTLGLLTIARLHPIDALTQGLVAGLTVGVFTGLCRWALGYSPGVVTVLGASAAMGAFRVFGIFRHSPIGISFGPVVSHLLSSPAMHHIHHSRDPRHHDKNFGTVFSIWDRLLGTLYIPTETHGLRFGLDASERLRSLGGCLWAPLRESARAAIGAERAAPPIPLSGKSEPLY
jgi:sterol desaturase/sphingolipid hydroxylase (fatty acid hydroxylase superfamily)